MSTGNKFASGEVNTIIFSKNRSCQLELLLRSLTLPSTVLYTHDPEFEKGYKKVISMYPSVNFIKETDFKSDVINMITNGCDYVMFLVDDDVMVRPFTENEHAFRKLKIDPQIICLSLRLSPAYRKRGLPRLKNNKWEWKRYARGSAEYRESLRIWGYPMCVGGNIFRKQDVLDSLTLAPTIKNPSFLEGALNLKLPDRPWAIMCDNAKFINNEANQVQTDFFSHTVGASPLELEKRFVSGERLSLSDMVKKSHATGDYFVQTQYEWEKTKT